MIFFVWQVSNLSGFLFLIKSSEEDLVKEEKEFQEKQLKERELLKKRQALIDISSNKKN